MRFILMFVLCTAEVAFACLGPLPQQINYSGTTYSGSPITIRSNGYWSLEFDGDKFAYDVSKKQWCINKTNCSEDQVTMSLNGKTVGICEMKGPVLFLFSVDAQGQKDLSKPYLKITDSSTLAEPASDRSDRHLSAKWNIEAFDGGAKVGGYSAENPNQSIGPDGSVYSGVRGITIEPPASKSVTDMRGNELQSSGCGTTSVSRFSKPTFRMSDGSSGGTAR